MEYGVVVPGVFVHRPNRFVAHVLVAGRQEVCHVPNTGRCRELLVPGAAVWLRPAEGTARKTAYSLIAVEKMRPDGRPLLINMDAQAPNRVLEEAAPRLFPQYPRLRREVTYGGSRFDFMLAGDGGDTAYVEAKGVTLEDDGVARFPDAPTQRGVKHIHELMAARAAGHGAYICFVIQMSGVSRFEPNDITHPAFGDALRAAAAAGVSVLAWDCAVAPGSLRLGRPVPVAL